MLYLLHFSARLGRDGSNGAQHYLGYADSIEERLERHREGGGAKITDAANARGITYHVSWWAPGDRKEERRQKRRGHFERLCPACKEQGSGRTGKIHGGPTEGATADSQRGAPLG